MATSGYIKRGHQAPLGWRPKRFNSIYIAGDLHYCASHYFLYNEEHEEEKLYNGQPCYYTDKRFISGSANYFKECYIVRDWFRRNQKKKKRPVFSKHNRCPREKRGHGFSLKACLRIMRKVSGIPKGTIVEFSTDWYWPGKRIDTRFIYIQKKEKLITHKFEIYGKSFTRNFDSDEYAQSLVTALREAGFIISVHTENPHRLIGECDGQSCIGWGFGKKFGFSTFNNELFGYHDGRECILYDHYGEFCKWSRCLGIKKGTPVEEVVKLLQKQRNENE